MLYLLLFLNIVFLCTTIWFYTKWRAARKTLQPLNRSQSNPTQLYKPSNEILIVKHQSFASLLKEYTNSLKSTYPKHDFIHYHEDQYVSVAEPVIKEIQEFLKSILSLTIENQMPTYQILLHSRIKQAQFQLRLQLPTTNNTELMQVVTDELTKKYHADISTQSQKSIITMVLPITDVTNKRIKLDQAVSPQTPKATIQLNPDDNVILIIEDNNEVAEFIATCIPSMYKTYISNNGHSGADMAFELIPDIIISDIMMPRLDGLELCSLLKNDIRTEHIPIILLTAKAADQDKIEGLKHGADAYLTKPFDETELQVRINNLLTLRDKIRTQQGINSQKPHKNELFITTLRQQLEVNYRKEEFGVQQLADAMHMSRMQLHRKAKSTLNHTTSEVINEFRLEKALKLIKDSNKRMSEIAYNVGFSDAGYFSKVFKSKYGMSPSQMRDK